MSKTKSELEKSLTQGPRTDLSNSFSKASGVALLLFRTQNDLELLFIKRAQNPLDNWSGQIAFPGGRQAPQDLSLLETCLREVEEEIGVPLAPDHLIGLLDDLQARKRGALLDFYIRPFVFYIPQKPTLKLDFREVEKALWVPLSHLKDPQFQIIHEAKTPSSSLQVPAIKLSDGDTLWGLSYMMILDFLKRLP